MATTKNVASGTQTTSIGTVKSVIGTVTATDTSGVTRTLQVGDKVFANEMIQTADSGAILIEFPNGTHADLGRNSSLTLDLDVFNPAQAASEQSDIAAIQAQIAAGADPTQVADASAAGAGAGDEGGSSFVVVDQLAAQGNVTSGFPTEGIGAGFLQSSGLLNDSPPPVATNDENNVVEDDLIVADGNLLGNDVSLSGGGLAVTGIPAGGSITLEGSYGTLVINSDGSYTYTLNNSSSVIQGLAEGQQVKDEFEYIANDGFKESNVATLTITVTGTNDIPVATANTGSLAEDSTFVSGNMITDNNGFGVDSDTDANAVISVTGVSGGNQHGTLTFNADGSYTYTLDNSDPAVQALGVGQFITDIYTYTLTDDQGASDTATLTITITGTNDDPVATANLNSISEDGSSVSGNMITDDDGFGVDHDVDANAVLSVTHVSGGNVYGTLSFNADGSYTYHLNSDNPTVQGLNNGQTLTEVYTYTLSDGAGGSDTATVTITIVGSNDNSGPVAVRNIDSMTAQDISVSGNMITDNDGFGVDSDPDGDSLSVISVSGTGAHGNLEFSSNGSYTYTLNPEDEAVAALAHGQTLTETFTYTISDGHGGTDSATLSIVISGTNHEPVATANFNSVTEDGESITVSGNMITDDNGYGQDTDADGDTLEVTNVSGGDAYGTLTFDEHGNYTYALDNNHPDVQALRTEQTLTETYTYTISDGAGGFDTAQLTITINGTNDGPVATNDGPSASADGLSIDENDVSTSTTTLNGVLANDTDVDTPHEDLFVSAIRTGSEAGSGTAGSLGTALTGSYGTLTLYADGHYTYALDNTNPTVDALNTGDFLQDVFTYTMSDGELTDTAQLTITINGTNDGPVATNDGQNISEGASSISATALNGVLANDTDVDTAHEDLTVTAIRTGSEAGSGTAGSLGTALTGSYGTLTLYADGHYTYALDNTNAAVNALDDGESLQDVFTYTMSDGELTDTAQLTITINGTNDAPTVDPMKTVFMPDGNDQMVGAYQHGYALALNAPSDVDGESLTITVTTLPSVGQLGYVDGTGFHAITGTGTITQDQFLSLTYKPDGVATYGTDGSPLSGADSTTFVYTVSDGTATATGTVDLRTLLGTGAHTDTVRIGDGNTPLTSGHDQTVAYIVSQALADQGSYSNAALYLKTDFHVRSSKDLSSAVESQVTVKIVVDGHEFIAIADENGVNDWAQHGTNANAGGYWDTTILFSNTYATIDGNPVSLSSYLASNSPSAGDSWTVIYDDDTGGNEQARYLDATFINDVDGTPAVTTTGTSGIDLIYGSTAGGDSLSGGDGNDTIIAREGNDILVGGGGNDILVGNAGNDTLTGGLGNDTMRGGDGHDTFVFGANSYTAPGNDVIEDFTIGNPTSSLTPNADILKISDVLTAANSEHSAIPTNIADAISGGFLTMQASGTTVNIVLDLDGSGSGTNSVQIVTLHNIPVADQANLLSTLLSNQELT